MTNNQHRQVPEALIDLIDTYAATCYRCGGIYNAKTEAARNAVIEALSGVQALSAAPAVTSEQRRLIGVIADKIEDGTLFQSGIYPKKDLARFVRNMLDVTPTAPAASPTPPSLSPACGYFSFSDDCGFDRHDTVEAAKAAATEMLADIRSELCGEEWPMEVESICWGVVVERAAEHETTTGEDGEKYCDYMLKGASLTPKAEQSEAEADAQLLKFYGVTTAAELITAQARHIEKLQTKLPQTPSFAPQRVREG